MSTAFWDGETNRMDAMDSREFLNDFSDLAACVAHDLNGGQSRSCRLVAFHRRLAKVIVEFDVITENGAGANTQRYIGKIYKVDGGQESFNALSRLWEAGFRPPSPFTVACPIAYIADRGLLLQEKAPGRLLSDIILSEPDVVADALVRTSGWLVALHTAAVGAQSRLEQVRADVARYGRELAELLPQQAPRIERLEAHALAGLEARRLTPMVLSHGDFHPRNVFIADSGRVTAIDLDTFGWQERAADVAYFLVQTAIMGYFRRGSFTATARARYCFLRAYLDAAPPLCYQRLVLYLGIGFLQSLHYELCVLHTDNAAIVEPWLSNAERCLLDAEVTLIEDQVHGSLAEIFPFYKP